MDPQIVERDELLDRLDTFARQAATGQGHVAVVTGEAGAGKTTLLRVFEARVGGAVRVLHGACEDLSIPEPLGPLRDLAQEADADLTTFLEEEHDRLAVFARALTLFSFTDRPTVLVIEDLHWADEATLDFVKFAARRINDKRLLMVVTARDEDNHGRPQLRRALGGIAPADVSRIALQPLSLQAVAALATGTDADAAEVYRVSGGNAFYVTELLRRGASKDLVNVQDAVLARADRLAKNARSMLDIVSIFPRRAERDWALALGEADEQAIDACVSAGLVTDDGNRLAFRHEIARQAVETALSPSQRRTLNRMVLTRMEAAGGIPFARRLHHARAAADRAEMARLAPLQAVKPRRPGPIIRQQNFWNWRPVWPIRKMQIPWQTSAFKRARPAMRSASTPEPCSSSSARLR